MSYGRKGVQSRDISIPSSTWGVSLKHIWDMAFHGIWLYSVEIPNGVMSIWKWAFHWNGLTWVTIPSSVTNIRLNAFNSNSLSSVTFERTENTSLSIPFRWQNLGSPVLVSWLSGTDSFKWTWKPELQSDSTYKWVLQWASPPADTQAPTGWSFTLPSTTSSTGITLSVTCPTDNVSTATGIFIAYGNTTNPTNWRTCSSSIPHTLTAWNGQKTVYVRFKDEANNTTSNSTQTTTLTTLTYTPESCFEFDPSTNTITKYKHTQSGCPKNVVIPETINNLPVKTLWSTAFYNQALTSVVIPESVKTIWHQTFQQNQLTSVTIPSSVKYIWDDAFSSNHLTWITIPNSVTHIWSFAFRFNKLTSVNIPTSVTNIRPAAFNNNKFPDNQAFIYARKSNGQEDTTHLISYAWENRHNIVIPSGVQTIDYWALDMHGLWKLSWSITIPQSVKTINDYAFSYNEISKIIFLPNSQLEYIGNMAFYDNKVTSLNLPASLAEIGNLAFAINKITSPLAIPNSVSHIWYGAFTDNQLSASEAFIYARNANWTPDYSTLVSYAGSNRVNITIPSSVTTIEQEAFAGLWLTTIALPAKLTGIAQYAFANNNITEVILPTPTTYLWMGSYVFQYNKISTVKILWTWINLSSQSNPFWQQEIWSEYPDNISWLPDSNWWFPPGVYKATKNSSGTWEWKKQ